MVETTSLREEKPKLSARDRLCLIQTINALPSTQFDELVFALDPPKGVIASSTAAQGTRSKDLLDWLEGSSGPGLTAADEVLQVLIPKATKTAPQPVAFVMMGQMGDLAPSELEAIVELLRQKTGDDSISLAFSRAGSIKLILNGSPEGLAKLQEIFKAGGLEQLDIPPVEAVTPVDPNTQDSRKARLIQVLSLRGRSSVNLDAEDIRLYRQFRKAALESTARELRRQQAARSDPYRDIARPRPLALARSLYRALVLSLSRARRPKDDIVIPRDLGIRGANLRNIDLSGANLRNINLSGVDLTGADLTYADVTGTIFGSNLGLTEADKHDLQNRGAIIQDPPSSDVPALALL